MLSLEKIVEMAKNLHPSYKLESVGESKDYYVFQYTDNGVIPIWGSVVNFNKKTQTFGAFILNEKMPEFKTVWGTPIE